MLGSLFRFIKGGNKIKIFNFVNFKKKDKVILSLNKTQVDLVIKSLYIAQCNINREEPDLNLLFKDVNDYERWYNNVENLSPKAYGAVTRFAIISRKSYDTYNTEQDDTYYNSLNDFPIAVYKEEDRNKLIDTGVAG